jgi:hypothetical protein
MGPLTAKRTQYFGQQRAVGALRYSDHRPRKPDLDAGTFSRAWTRRRSARSHFGSAGATQIFPEYSHKPSLAGRTRRRRHGEVPGSGGAAPGEELLRI